MHVSNVMLARSARLEVIAQSARLVLMQWIRGNAFYVREAHGVVNSGLTIFPPAKTVQSEDTHRQQEFLKSRDAIYAVLVGSLQSLEPLWHLHVNFVRKAHTSHLKVILHVMYVLQDIVNPPLVSHRVYHVYLASIKMKPNPSRVKIVQSGTNPIQTQQAVRSVCLEVRPSNLDLKHVWIANRESFF